MFDPTLLLVCCSSSDFIDSMHACCSAIAIPVHQQSTVLHYVDVVLPHR